jgi:hypothetical protein
LRFAARPKLTRAAPVTPMHGQGAIITPR